MFPRGPCEAGDIIEERWALLNSQAYYQFSFSLSCTHLHLSLSPHRWLITFFRLLNLAVHATVAAACLYLPPAVSRENKGTKYMLNPLRSPHQPPTQPSSSSSGARSVSLRRVPEPRMSHPPALLPSGLSPAVPILGEFFSSKAQR